MYILYYMTHKIEISDKTYWLLKEYCQLNNLKMGQFADKLLHDGIMIEKYGDVPFTDYKKPLEHVFEEEKREEQQKKLQEALGNLRKELSETQMTLPPDFAKVVNDHFFEMLSDNEIESTPVEDYDFSVKKEDVNEVEMDKPVGLPSWNTDPMPDSSFEANDYSTLHEEIKKNEEEVLKQAGVPTKVVNKINKRRLK